MDGGHTNAAMAVNDTHDMIRPLIPAELWFLVHLSERVSTAEAQKEFDCQIREQDERDIWVAAAARVNAYFAAGLRDAATELEAISIEPDDGNVALRTIDPAIVADAILMTEYVVDEAITVRWTEDERAAAFEWAMREHLSANDNDVDRLPCPPHVAALHKQTS